MMMVSKYNAEKQRQKAGVRSSDATIHLAWPERVMVNSCSGLTSACSSCKPLCPATVLDHLTYPVSFGSAFWLLFEVLLGSPCAEWFHWLLTSCLLSQSLTLAFGGGVACWLVGWGKASYSRLASNSLCYRVWSWTRGLLASSLVLRLCLLASYPASLYSCRFKLKTGLWFLPTVDHVIDASLVPVSRSMIFYSHLHVSKQTLSVGADQRPGLFDSWVSRSYFSLSQSLNFLFIPRFFWFLFLFRSIAPFLSRVWN